MISTNLKILDREYLVMEKAILAYLEVLQNAGTAYISLMKEISDYALDVPTINARLISLSKSVLGIIKDMEIIYKDLKGSAKQFIMDVDKKDDFLY